MENNRGHHFLIVLSCLVASCSCHQPLNFGNPQPCYIILMSGADVSLGYAHQRPECETRVGPKEQV